MASNNDDATIPNSSSPVSAGPLPPRYPQPPRPSLWRRFLGASRWAQVGVGCGALLLVCACCTVGTAAFGGGSGGKSTGVAVAPRAFHTQQPGNTTESSAATSAPPTTAPTATATATVAPTPTATPAPPPTAKPAAPPAAPTTKPTAPPRPTATPKPAQLFIRFTCADAVDHQSGEVCVHTEPQAQLRITVTYCSGYSATSRSLQGTVTADSAGNYTWTWTPDTKCQGTATADVTASWHNQSDEASNDFMVH